MKKTLSTVIAIAILVAAGLGAWWWVDQSSQTSQIDSSTSEQKTDIIEYTGQDNRTALELLEEKADIDKAGSGDMVYIKSINGTTADPSTEFWEFLVNGKPASVGAAQYVTQSNETITWQLTKIDTNYSSEDAQQ